MFFSCNRNIFITQLYRFTKNSLLYNIALLWKLFSYTILWIFSFLNWFLQYLKLTIVLFFLPLYSIFQSPKNLIEHKNLYGILFYPMLNNLKVV